MHHVKQRRTACRAFSLRAKIFPYDPSRPLKAMKGLYLKAQHKSQPKPMQYDSQRVKPGGAYGLG